VPDSHETSRDRLCEEWGRSEKVVEALLTQMEERQKQTLARTEQTKAETKALLSRLDRFDDPGGAAA
jgi:hypothetical protein